MPTKKPPARVYLRACGGVQALQMEPTATYECCTIYEYKLVPTKPKAKKARKR